MQIIQCHSRGGGSLGHCERSEAIQDITQNLWPYGQSQNLDHHVDLRSPRDDEGLDPRLRGGDNRNLVIARGDEDDNHGK